MNAELREELKACDFEAPAGVAMVAAVGRLLKPIPDEVLFGEDGINWRFQSEVKAAVLRYQAYVIGGEQ